MTTLNRKDRATALTQFRAVRARTERLASGLSPEDLTVQSMPDASPGKWHLGHTTWFFETFFLQKARLDWKSPDPGYAVLFNSYYQAVGPQWARAARGVLSRPTVAEVWSWRTAVDEAVARIIETAPEKDWQDLAPILEVGLNHEEQHQELFCTDLRHAFSLNPLAPAALPAPNPPKGTTLPPVHFLEGAEGIVEIGSDGRAFAFDNEGPRHQALLRPHIIADRLASNAEYLAFIEDGGYETSALWLAEGWERIQTEGWSHPLFWRKEDGLWREFTLHGLQDLDPSAPVSGLSGFEALAFANWAGARLPTEAEWEAMPSAQDEAASTGLFTRTRLHPQATSQEAGLRQRFGEVWQWTQSPYAPYPGFRAAAGALGEYNGKFMVNQLVLRGGSCVTPAGHSRITYRNFFAPHARWQFAGLRLARDL